MAYDTHNPALAIIIITTGIYLGEQTQTRHSFSQISLNEIPLNDKDGLPASIRIAA